MEGEEIGRRRGPSVRSQSGAERGAKPTPTASASAKAGQGRALSQEEALPVSLSECTHILRSNIEDGYEKNGCGFGPGIPRPKSPQDSKQRTHTHMHRMPTQMELCFAETWIRSVSLSLIRYRLKQKDLY
jgi:hypothetical protein